MLSASSDPQLDPPTSASAGDELVVSEGTAAFLVRQRAADIIEVVAEAADRDRPSSEASLG